MFRLDWATSHRRLLGKKWWLVSLTTSNVSLRITSLDSPSSALCWDVKRRAVLLDRRFIECLLQAHLFRWWPALSCLILLKWVHLVIACLKRFHWGRNARTDSGWTHTAKIVVTLASLLQITCVIQIALETSSTTLHYTANEATSGSSSAFIAATLVNVRQ